MNEPAAKRGQLISLLDRIDWVSLGKLRSSVMSRAISVLSISSLFLANAAPLVRELNLPTGTIERLFVGSILFLTGSLIHALRAPSYLATGAEVVEVVSRMRTLTDWNYFNGLRVEATNAHLDASTGRKAYYPPEFIAALQRRITTANGIEEGDSELTDKTPGLYQAYLELLKYSRPLARVLTASLMLAGSLILFWPVLANVFVAARDLIC
jgi:hypothetical protein